MTRYSAGHAPVLHDVTRDRNEAHSSEEDEAFAFNELNDPFELQPYSLSDGDLRTGRAPESLTPPGWL
jgi:hypothetical protein